MGSSSLGCIRWEKGEGTSILVRLLGGFDVELAKGLFQVYNRKIWNIFALMQLKERKKSLANIVI
jgi:hypothetical protein